MGVHFPSVGTVTIVTATIVTTAETIVATTGPINLPVDNAIVLLWWYWHILVGTGGTTTITRIRRGTATSGTQIFTTPAETTVPGNTTFRSGSYQDSPGVVAEQQYSITLALPAASGNSTVNDVFLLAMAL